MDFFIPEHPRGPQPVWDPQLACNIPDPPEGEHFQLELLHCQPTPSFTGIGSVCFSCYCGSGCLCGCVSK